MIIPINFSPVSSRRHAPLQPPLAKLGSNEVVLIELQGWLDVVEGEKHDGLIGTLVLENDKPVLIIGHHHLEGKLVSLPKPLAVLARDKPGENGDGDEGGAVSTCYNIVTIVKRKITFSKRPVPIVKRT